MCDRYDELAEEHSKCSGKDKDKDSDGDDGIDIGHTGLIVSLSQQIAELDAQLESAREKLRKYEDTHGDID